MDSNLLSNALRYTPPSEAIVGALPERSIIRCKFPSKTQVRPLRPTAPRLFDRFYSVVDLPRQRKGEGSGIGLAIVKWIAVAHKGTVAVTSDARGQGLLSHYPLNYSANGNFYNQCKNNVPQ
ncbi:ATP-binding protein [Shigella flexneri]